MSTPYKTNRKANQTVKTNPSEPASIFSRQAERRAKERRAREQNASRTTSTNRADLPCTMGIGPSTY